MQQALLLFLKTLRLARPTERPKTETRATRQRAFAFGPGRALPLSLFLASLCLRAQQNLSEENGLAERSEEIRGPFRKKNSVEEIKIETIPGPSALAAALAIAGLRANSFTFYGFLPHKKGRETIFKEIAASERASVFYESPHRIIKSLESLEKSLPPERRVGIFRELTKMFEESIVGSASEVKVVLESDPNRQRGEFVVIVEGE